MSSVDFARDPTQLRSAIDAARLALNRAEKQSAKLDTVVHEVVTASGHCSVSRWHCGSAQQTRLPRTLLAEFSERRTAREAQTPGGGEEVCTGRPNGLLKSHRPSQRAAEPQLVSLRRSESMLYCAMQCTTIPTSRRQSRTPRTRGTTTGSSWRPQEMLQTLVARRDLSRYTTATGYGRRRPAELH